MRLIRNAPRGVGKISPKVGGSQVRLKTDSEARKKAKELGVNSNSRNASAIYKQKR